MELVTFFFSFFLFSFFQNMDLQMVQNGDHKCTTKLDNQFAEEKTISEDETVYLKVFLDLLT